MQSARWRSEESQFALHSPLATHLIPRSQPPIQARNRRTRYIVERWSPRAGAVVRARRLRAWAGTGPRLRLSNLTLRGPHTALARDGGPTSSDAGSAVGPPGLSNAPRARGPAPERQRYAELLRCAADAVIAAPWRNRGSLCRCSLRPVRRPAQLAVWPPRRFGGQRHSTANSNVSRPASGAQVRAFTWSGQRALAALDMKPARKPAGQASSFSLGRRSQAR